MKRKLILSCTSLVLALVFSVTVAYAWFTSSSSVNNIIITTGEMKVSADLYYAKDFDLDGNIDLDEDDKAILEKHDENPISVVGLLPGQVKTFVIEVVNTGTISGTVSVNLLGLKEDLRNVISINGKSCYGKDEMKQVVLNSDIILKAKEKTSIYLQIKFETLDYLEVSSNLGIEDNNNPFIKNGLSEIQKYHNKRALIDRIELILTQVVQ